MTNEKEALEVAKKLNAEAVERAKQDNTMTKAEEAQYREKVFFEDDEVIKLRDGRNYHIPPCSLKDARILMSKLKTVNVDAIILNFIPTGDDERDKQRVDDLFDILAMAFKNYPHVTRDYMDEFIDLNTARKIIEILIGINGLKK